MCRDTDLFIQLLKPHYNDALKYCRALCANRAAEAEDVLQQSFLQALEKFHTLNDINKFKSWFFTIITRAFYTSIRKSFWKRFMPVENIPLPALPEVFQHVEQNETREILNHALSKLSPKERTCILLYEIAGFSIEEVTKIQGERSISAIKSRLSRSRKKLKQLILHLEAENEKNFTYSKTNFLGDIENETLKLAGQVKTDK